MCVCSVCVCMCVCWPAGGSEGCVCMSVCVLCVYVYVCAGRRVGGWHTDTMVNLNLKTQILKDVYA